MGRVEKSLSQFNISTKAAASALAQLGLCGGDLNAIERAIQNDDVSALGALRQHADACKNNSPGVFNMLMGMFSK